MWHAGRDLEGMCSGPLSHISLPLSLSTAKRVSLSEGEAGFASDCSITVILNQIHQKYAASESRTVLISLGGVG